MGTLLDRKSVIFQEREWQNKHDKLGQLLVGQQTAAQQKQRSARFCFLFKEKSAFKSHKQQAVFYRLPKKRCKLESLIMRVAELREKSRFWLCVCENKERLRCETILD